MREMMVNVIPNYKTHCVSGIYLFMNKQNNKVYVGQTNNLYQRYHRHKRSVNVAHKNTSRVVSAFKKYGFNNFNFYILEFVCRDRLTEREQFWMDKYRCSEREFGYNLYPAAGSSFGYKHSKETREKVSKTSKGRKHSEETRRLMSSLQKGKIASEESKRKNSEWHKGRKIPNKRGRAVYQVDKFTNKIIDRFISGSSAQRKTGINVSAILEVAKGGGKRKSAGGFYWIFV